MIRRSFQFLDGIGNELERKIVAQVSDWHGFLEAKHVRGISEKRKSYYDRHITKARNALYNFNSEYFNSFPQSLSWRLYEFFKDEACFLDIETSGFNGHITVFGIFDGLKTKTMVQGINLNFSHLKEELKKYKLFVTFNGSSFDLPFIKKRYPDLLPNLPHFDLKHACRKIGLVGGLKNIETQIGIKRNPIIQRIYGGDPITLWRMYRGSGDDYYLKLLIEYNEDDVINLKTIAELVYDRLKKSLV